MFNLRSFLIFMTFSLSVFAQAPLPHLDNEINHHPPLPETEEHDYNIPSTPHLPNTEFTIPDFLVNEQEGNSPKYQTRVAVNQNGVSFVVWADNRNGNTMCFGQIIDSTGIISGPEFQINPGDNNRAYTYPDVAANDNGEFLVVWQDGRSWYHIYSQLYHEDGTPIGSEIDLMDVNEYGHHYRPRVSYNNNQFVVVWYDTREGYQYDIFGQRLDINGAKIDSNFVVNDDIQSYRKYSPAVAVNEDGDFLVSWYGNSSSYNNIYAREFYSDAAPKDTVYQLSVDSTNSHHYYPAIGVIDTGYVIAWYGQSNGYYKILGQTYETGAGPINGIYEITDDGSNFYAYQPDIATMGNNELLVSWYDIRNGNYQYYGQFFIADQKNHINFLLTDLSETGYKNSGSVACNSLGNITLIWLDQGTPMNYYVKARQLYSDGNPKSVSFRVDSDENSSSQSFPAIAVRQDGSFITTWEDFRNRRKEIFFQQFSQNGTPIDSNKYIDFNTSTKYRPDIATSNNDGFILTWYEYRSPRYEIIAQRYDAFGVSLDDPFIVSTNNIGTHCYVPSIASNRSGEFVIAWYQYVNSAYKIFAQLYNANGDTVGSNISVNSDSINSVNYFPKVGIDSTGGFAIVWQSNALSTGTDYDILMQRYDSSGLALGDNFIINDDTTNAAQYNPDITVDASGVAIVAWDDRRNPNNIYYQRFLNIGSIAGFSVEGSNTIISNETQYCSNIRVEMNNQQDFVISFSKYNNGSSDIFFKAFNNDGSEHSDIVVASTNTDRQQIYPDMAFAGDKIYNTWQDNHLYGVGYDIYANVFDWSDVVAGTESIQSTIPVDYNLSQNYPNPFNPTTNINFALPNHTKVKIDIFNALGQKVYTLLNSTKSAGKHTVEFNGSNIASGIYYYRIQAGNFNQVKKMILMK